MSWYFNSLAARPPPDEPPPSPLEKAPSIRPSRNSKPSSLTPRSSWGNGIPSSSTWAGRPPSPSQVGEPAPPSCSARHSPMHEPSLLPFGGAPSIRSSRSRLPSLTPRGSREDFRSSWAGCPPPPSQVEEPAPPSCVGEPAPPSCVEEPAPPSCTEEPAPPPCTEEPAPPLYVGGPVAPIDSPEVRAGPSTGKKKGKKGAKAGKLPPPPPPDSKDPLTQPMLIPPPERPAFKLSDIEATMGPASTHIRSVPEIPSVYSPVLLPVGHPPLAPDTPPSHSPLDARSTWELVRSPSPDRYRSPAMKCDDGVGSPYTMSPARRTVYGAGSPRSLSPPGPRSYTSATGSPVASPYVRMLPPHAPESAPCTTFSPAASIRSVVTMNTPQPKVPLDPVRRLSRGSEISIMVQGFEFQAVSSYLTRHSPFFQKHLGGSNPGKNAILQLDSDPIDFEHFLEVLHFGAIDTDDFLSTPANPGKVTKLLAVAETAIKYQDSRLGAWALRHGLSTLEANEGLTTTTVVDRLMRIATQCAVEGIGSSVHRQLQEVIIHAMKTQRLSSEEIVGRVILPLSATGHSSSDTFLLAHAYYYLLQGDHITWTNDDRLDATHRRRLFCGHFALAAAWQDRVRATGTVLGGANVNVRREVEEQLNHASSPCALLDRMRALSEVARRFGEDTLSAILARAVEEERDRLWDYFGTARWGV